MHPKRDWKGRLGKKFPSSASLYQDASKKGLKVACPAFLDCLALCLMHPKRDWKSQILVYSLRARLGMHPKRDWKGVIAIWLRAHGLSPWCIQKGIESSQCNIGIYYSPYPDASKKGLKVYFLSCFVINIYNDASKKGLKDCIFMHFFQKIIWDASKKGLKVFVISHKQFKEFTVMHPKRDWKIFISFNLNSLFFPMHPKRDWKFFSSSSTLLFKSSDASKKGLKVKKGKVYRYDIIKDASKKGLKV